MMPGVPAADRLTLAFIADPNSIHNHRWLGWFARRGHEVYLLDGFDTEVQSGLDPRIQVVRYQMAAHSRLPLMSTVRTRRNVRALLLRLQPDVVHAQFLRRYGWQSAITGFHPRVISVWGSDVLRRSRTTWRQRAWDQFALRTADMVTAVSPILRQAAIDAGADPRRVEIVQHGVDTEQFAPGPVDNELLASHGLLARRIVFSSRAIRPLYRHDTVIAAVAQLPSDAALVMSARGADQQYLGMLKEQMRELGVSERVLILDDIEEKDVLRFLRSAAVVVSLPESDSFPLTLLEAMACAVPVVATALPAARDVLGAIDPECLAPVGDAQAAAIALRRALELTPTERQRLGQVLREYVVTNADYETNMARMEGLYRQLAGSRVRRR
jgi:glycosyltransferase involved in cell wall biosynthesis